MGLDQEGKESKGNIPSQLEAIEQQIRKLFGEVEGMQSDLDALDQAQQDCCQQLNDKLDKLLVILAPSPVVAFQVTTTMVNPSK